jgi:sugar O-acyltransferase (sialic acid O-acetyltransferase NeuD family)
LDDEGGNVAVKNGSMDLSWPRRADLERRAQMARVVIFGTTEMAVMAHFYLTHDSAHEVVAFTVDQAFMNEEMLCGLPVVPFEQLKNRYPPDQCQMLVSVAYGRVNKSRAEKYQAAKTAGYALINYVSSKALAWPGLIRGDNCFVLEGSVVQPFAEIGNNVVVAPGAIVGHHTVVKDHCFLAAHSVLLGCVTVEPYCFLGANSTVRDSTTIAEECIIGAGVTITKNTKAREVYVTEQREPLPMPSDRFSSLLTWGAR